MWFGSNVCCLSCDACNLRWSAIGNVSISAWRCCALVSCVHPVQHRRVAFWTVCSFLMLVSEVLGDRTVFAYSIVGLVMVL